MVLTCRTLVLAFAIVLHAAFLPAADGKGKGKKKGAGIRSGGTMTSPAPPIRIGREGEYPIGGTWFFLGPFPVGKTEIDGDPLEAFGGIGNISVGDDSQFYSELVDDGKVGWGTVQARPGTGAVGVGFNFNKLVQGLSKLTALEFQGWLVNTFELVHGGMYLLRCSPSHHLSLDGRILHGNIYNSDFGWSPVRLAAGGHTIRIRVRAKGQATLSCSIRPATSQTGSESPLELFPPAGTTPDLVGGALPGGEGFVGIPVLNTGERWERVTFTGTSSGLTAAASHTWGRGLDPGRVPIIGASADELVAPGQALIVPVRLFTTPESGGVGDGGGGGVWAHDAPGDGACLNVGVRVGDSKGVVQPLQIGLRCRKMAQSFVITYIDHDSSVASAAAVRPWEECPEPVGCPVLLSLSGVGVNEMDQADSHKHIPKGGGKDFVFGYKAAWVLAPQRDGAHNWEGTGHQTAVQSIRALDALANSRANQAERWGVFSGRKADTSRILFAGHSRGGHGAWMMGMHYPDLAVGVASLSGWWRREMYADANILFDLDTQLSFMDPALKGIFESTLIDHDSSQLASNLKGIPVQVRTGGDDASVPPWHTRRMARLLSELGVDVTFTEFPGKGHWWWDTKRESDGGAMNDDRLRTFYETALASPRPPPPSSFEMTVYNPSTHAGKAGFRVQQQHSPLRKTSIFVNISPGVVSVRTLNARRMSLTDAYNVFFSGKELHVDGTKLTQKQVVILSDPGSKSTLLDPVGNGGWVLVDDGGEWKNSQRSAETGGPARQVLTKPFLIVTATKGTPEELQALHDVAIYMSMGHAYASKTTSRIVNDTVIASGLQSGGHLAEDYNLVVVGGPAYNKAASSLLSLSPMKEAKLNTGYGPGAPEGEGEHWLTLGPCKVRGRDTAGLITSPRRLKRGGLALDLHLAGGSIEAISALVRYSFAVDQALTRAPFSNMVPDYVITGGEFSYKGYGGVVAAGYWGNDWEWRADVGWRMCGGGG